MPKPPANDLNEPMHQMACHECDLVHAIPPMPNRATARCVRCGAVLFRTKLDTIDRTLAWTIGSLVMYGVAVSFPFLAMSSNGMQRDTALLSGIGEIYAQGMIGVASLVLLTCVLTPLMQLLGLLYIFLPLKLGRPAKFSRIVFRLFQHIQPWSMMEVFMLGILVALVKLASMATIIPGLAIFAFGLLIFALAFAISSVDAHLVWERLGGHS